MDAGEFALACFGIAALGYAAAKFAATVEHLHSVWRNW